MICLRFPICLDDCWYTNILIFYLAIVFFESAKISKNPLLFLGTFFAILIGNIAPGIGTLIKILGFNLNPKKYIKIFKLIFF